ncbi:MAG: hypothetical protein LQ342_005929 [Letrouitia transgressa]|nr:MAG: hypothetical protein LQ342_005929 [Letrouitia transgressa]
MSNTEEQNIALTNRSLRTIRTELEYLADTKVITPAQLTSIQNILPAQVLLSPSAQQTATSQQASTPSLGKNPTTTYNSPPAPVASPAIPPPAYAHVPAPRTLASASALYEYLPSDDGDLALLPNDRISITEFMNADWAKGRNERTGQEGIFPRSYVSIIDEKSAMVQQPPPPPSSSHYGNMPLDVSQSGSNGGGVESKFNQQGKKFGKKMGNAAIFGAGATIGSNMVNKIF